MINGIRASNIRDLDKGRSSKFRVRTWVWQETAEEGRRKLRLKLSEYNHKDEDNSPKTLNDKKFKKVSWVSHLTASGGEAQVLELYGVFLLTITPRSYLIRCGSIC